MRRLGPVLLLAACHHAAPPPGDEWRSDLERYRAKRLESIAGPDGWLTLVARTWIEEGDNAVGSDPHDPLALPASRAPAQLMVLTRAGDRIHAKVFADAVVTVDGKPFVEGDLKDDRDGQEPTVLEHGSLTLRVIKRGDRFALRVKDRGHPARKTFPGLTYYPIDPALRLTAHLEPAPAGKTLPIVNILGQTEAMKSPGTLHFSIGGKPYTLDAVVEAGEKELFILFRDETAGKGTYPSGRFLYASPPDANGNVELDFNRAFSPPCAFTHFATCPLPPQQNRLAVAIEAGEIFAGHHD